MVKIQSNLVCGGNHTGRPGSGGKGMGIKNSLFPCFF